MKKVFISQPMAGLSNMQILAEREKAIKTVNEYFHVKSEEIEIIDSYIDDYHYEDKPVLLLGEAIKRLSEADYVFFVKGWEHARGCKVEHMVAENYRIPYLEESCGDLTIKVYN